MISAPAYAELHDTVHRDDWIRSRKALGRVALASTRMDSGHSWRGRDPDKNLPRVCCCPCWLPGHPLSRGGNPRQSSQAGRAEVTRRYLIVMEGTSTGYSAYSPDLPGCVGDRVDRFGSGTEDAQGVRAPPPTSRYLPDSKRMHFLTRAWSRRDEHDGQSILEGAQLRR